MKPLIAALLFMSCGAGAQSLDEGTWDVENQDITIEGRLDGCSLVFTAVTRDNAYLGGKQVILNGSIALRTVGKTDLFFTGKLGTRQWGDAGPGKWEAPVHFHFFSPTGTTAGKVKIMDAETQGYRLLLGRATDDEILRLVTDISKNGEFGVGFNRRTGGQDVVSQIKINTSLKRTPNGGGERVTSNDVPVAYATCVARLLDGLTKQLDRK